jgi:adenosylhomocysteine nucleosidase
MKIGIIGAMEEELISIRSISQHLESFQQGNRTFWHGEAHGHEIYLTRCDPGKVNAAIATQQLINFFSPDAIFNMGSSGALSPDLEVGDLVVATESVQHDFDLTMWGMKPGELIFDVTTAENGQLKFRSQQAFPSDAKLVQLTCDIAQAVELTKLGEYTPKIHMGRIASGDQFISKRERADEIWKSAEALCTDMEAAAIAHTCVINATPFLCMRAISDKADHSAMVSFTDFLVAATSNYGKIFDRVIQEFDGV